MGNGVDIRSLFQAIPAKATAIAIAAALSPIVGSFPEVINFGEYHAIRFNEEQADRLTEWILMQLRKEPGPVRVESGSIALRVVTRQYWPWFLGTFMLGALVSRRF
jgi:hypothetical protein